MRDRLGGEDALQGGGDDIAVLQAISVFSKILRRVGRLYLGSLGSLDFERGFLVALDFQPHDEVGAIEGFVVAEAEALSMRDFLSVDGEHGRPVAPVLHHERRIVDR